MATALEQLSLLTGLLPGLQSGLLVCLPAPGNCLTDWRGGAYEPHNSQPPGGDSHVLASLHNWGRVDSAIIFTSCLCLFDK